MNIIFSDIPMPTTIVKSLFLAGPSPRDKATKDWRMDALSHLRYIGYDGTVFVPIPENKFYGKDDSPEWTYDNQINWECTARNVADIILFWVPRNISGNMPAFTTNVEFGEDLNSGKIMYGRPDNAEKCRYLDKRIQDLGLALYTSLENILDAAIKNLGKGAERNNGEVYIPLCIWETEQFQSWYTNLKIAGNRLDFAHIKSCNKTPNGLIFAYTLHAKIWIYAESRFKDNEIIFSRKDISSVLAYYKDENQNTKIILVKEFRSAVNNSVGFVYELPGGSSCKPGEDPLRNARTEFYEETGLFIESTNRFNFVNKRQLASTIMSHESYLYSIELTKNEFNTLSQYAQNNISFTDEYGCEKTYVVVVDVKDLKNVLLDYSMLGMIYEGLLI